MRQVQNKRLTPKMQQAIDELMTMIRGRYPNAQFDVTEVADEPPNVQLLTFVDIEEPEEVLDLVIDRLLELQVEERLPIHVIPLRSRALITDTSKPAITHA